jgi:hypothetical protein
MLAPWSSTITISQRTANTDGTDATAAGMMGIVWCSSEDQRPMERLVGFSVPKERVTYLMASCNRWPRVSGMRNIDSIRA